jgi:hypothetical protein
LIDQGERQFGLRLQRDLGGDIDFGPPGGVGRSGLGQGELRGHGPMHGGAARWLIAHVVRADDDLAIGHRAQGAGILAGDADRAVPLLGQPSVVPQQETLGRTLGHQGLDALPVEGLGIPGRIGQEMMQAFVEVPTTAAAMMSLFLRGRSVSNPVR